MKVEQKKGFNPITITLESEEEARLLGEFMGNLTTAKIREIMGSENSSKEVFTIDEYTGKIWNSLKYYTKHGDYFIPNSQS